MTAVMNLFRLEVAPEDAAEMAVAGRANMHTSVTQEPGTRAMFLGQAADGAYYVFEHYADAVGYQAHREGQPFQTYRATMGPKLVASRQWPTLPVLGLSQGRLSEQALLRLAHIRLQADAVSDFQALVTWEMQESLRQEAGVLALYAMQEADDPTAWHFFEVYADAAAYEAHRQTPHFQRYLSESQDWVEDKQLIELTPLVVASK